MSGLADHLDQQVLRWEIGRRLGRCDLTGAQLDARTAVLLEDPDGRTLGVVRPEAWAGIRDRFLADHPTTIVKNSTEGKN